MPTEADFLAAIRDEPDDLTHRLVFADWLEEQDNPRAELVRGIARYQQSQVEGLLTPSFQSFRLILPTRLSQGFFALRESGMLAVAPSGLLEWSTSLSMAGWRIPDDASWWPWVTHLRLRATRDQLAELLDRMESPPVHVEWLLNPGDVDLERLQDDPLLTRLHGIRVIGADMMPGRASFAPLLSSPLPRLRRLDVGARMLGTSELEVLTRNPSLGRLTSLFLGHSPADRGAFGRLLRASWWSGVRELRLLCREEDGPLLRLLAGSANSARLRVLEIDQPGIGSLDLEALSGAAFWPGLKALSIGCHVLPVDTLHRLLNMLQLGELLALRLPFRTPGGDVLRAVVNCPYLTRTTHLIVGGEMPRCRPLHLLSTGRYLPRLHSLDLRAAEINDTQIHDLADLPTLGQFQHLRLFRNTCTAEGASWLARQEHLRNLVSLDLAAAPLQREGIVALAESPHLRNLMNLVLSSKGENRDVLRALFSRIWSLSL
jgi:uncharacterized protein (TIGR02996 family)